MVSNCSTLATFFLFLFFRLAVPLLTLPFVFALLPLNRVETLFVVLFSFALLFVTDLVKSKKNLKEK